MTIAEIKSAVDAGLRVHWANEGYVVHKDRLGQYLISFLPNGSSIGLTDRSGERLNGAEAEFFIAGSPAGPMTGKKGAHDGSGRTTSQAAARADGRE